MKLRFLSKLKQFRWSKLLLIWLVFLLIAGVLFAERCGITYQAVSKWENDTGMPDILHVVPLSSIFKVSTDVVVRYCRHNRK